MSNQSDIELILSFLQDSLEQEEAEVTRRRIKVEPDFAALVKKVKLLRDGAILSKKKSLLQTLKKLEQSRGSSQSNQDDRPEDDPDS